LKRRENPVDAVIAKSRGAFLSSALFSCAINILMLTGPLFMLQVYDRILSSRSIPTLLALFGLVAGLYLFLGLFDFIRARVLSRVGFRLDVELAAIAKRSWIFSGLAKNQQSRRPLNELSVIRQFVGSNGLPSLFDLPWIPVYLAIVYLLHSWLGMLATVGAIIVIAATILGEIITRRPVSDGAGWDVRDQNFSESSNRNAEAIVSMGMIANVTRHWEGLRHRSLKAAQVAGGYSEFISALTKSTRLLIQSSILALGAYLAVYQEITPGVMIAASILAGRALAPVDAAVGNWKHFVRARQAFRQLKELLTTNVTDNPPLDLPAPVGRLSVTGLAKLADGSKAGNPRPILSGIKFNLEPGDGLGVIGPSASGKSTLARLLVGLGRAEKGEVRFDGAGFDQWDRDEIGKYIGYLPQSVELLPGTVSQNIARFAEDAKDEDVVTAAKLAGVHDMILRLPGGYGTNLENGELVLSGGQSQRIALARAVYRKPPLVVLDEPNAHLDMEGDAALTNAIVELRKAGSSVVVMAHRPSPLIHAN